MLTYAEARYVITEIARRGFYRAQLIKLQSELDLINEKKIQISSPNCPQGRISIGEAKGNEVSDFSKTLAILVTKQEELNRQRDFFISLLVRATDYYEILMDGKDANFTREYFETEDKRVLQAKYNISNAYDRMIRIARQEIVRL